MATVTYKTKVLSFEEKVEIFRELTRRHNPKNHNRNFDRNEYLKCHYFINYQLYCHKLLQQKVRDETDRTGCTAAIIFKGFLSTDDVRCNRK